MNSRSVRAANKPRQMSASPWDGLLGEAVRQGLGATATTPATRVQAMLDSQLESPAQIADDEEYGALISPVRDRVSAATARTMALLRGDADGPALRAELEAWMLEAGRLEAVVEDAIGRCEAAREASREGQAEASAEAAACRRALELHIANRNRESAQLAAREAEDESARGEERLRLEAELGQARAEVSGLAEQHGCVNRAKGQRSEHIRAARTLYEPRG